MKTPPLPVQPALTTRVLCVDDSTDMTDVMRMVINAEPMMLCVGCLDSADRLLEEVRRLKPTPDVVLLDATMPGKNPLKVMRDMRAEFPAIRTIIFSGHDDAAFIERSTSAGAWACVSKSDDTAAILQVLRRAAAEKDGAGRRSQPG